MEKIIQAQMEQAVKAYAEISGMSQQEIFAACSDMDSQIAKNVILLMFAAG